MAVFFHLKKGKKMGLNFYRYKHSLHFIFYQRWLKEGEDGAFTVVLRAQKVLNLL
jgi:hypothetical protein